MGQMFMNASTQKVNLDQLHVTLLRKLVPYYSNVRVDRSVNDFEDTVRISWKNPKGTSMWTDSNLIIVEEEGIERLMLFNVTNSDTSIVGVLMGALQEQGFDIA